MTPDCLCGHGIDRHPDLECLTPACGCTTYRPKPTTPKEPA